METHINSEYEDFELYHKNIYNIGFHIFCGILFMTFFLLSFKKYNNVALALYSLLLLFTINNIIVTGIVLVLLFSLSNIIFTKNNYSQLTLFGLFLVFYLLPDLSHYLTNEKTVLTIENITPFNAFVNIFYLLPFSIMCLFNSS